METKPVDEMRLLNIGDVRCACGLVFRYALTTEGPTFWPQNSPWGFSATPVDDDGCIRCSAPLGDLVPRPPHREPAAA